MLLTSSLSSSDSVVGSLATAARLLQFQLIEALYHQRCCFPLCLEQCSDRFPKQIIILVAD